MTPNATILLVHDHPIAGEMILSFIQTHKPLCRILLVDHPEKALAYLRQEPVHLVIANLQGVPSEDSFAFLAMLNGWNPPIPIIVIDESLPEDLPLLAGGVTVLPPPIDFDILLELLNTMVLAAQESVLNGVSLKVFLQMLDLERKTCTLRIISGYQMGYLYLLKGRLVSAKTGALRDRAAVIAILDWPNCTITISEGPDIKETMDVPIQTILMEWCIYRDEQTSASARLTNAC
jgi:hypothetical protein